MEIRDFYHTYHDHQPRLLNARGEFAVLVPLVETAQGLSLLYEVRSGGIRQPHEVCFPGGRMEAGETPTACALRETEEELGIPASAIQVIAPLDFLYLRSDALMHPVLAGVAPSALTQMQPSPDEVADTFLVPVQWLREHPPTLYRYPLRPMIGEDFPLQHHPHGRLLPLGRRPHGGAGLRRSALPPVGPDRPHHVLSAEKCAGLTACTFLS